MKQLPLHDILGVPLNTAFRCIMHGHKDIHPSANVQLRKVSTYTYFCHGCYGEGMGKSLIDLIMEATNCDIVETVSFAEIALNITLQTEHQLQCRKRCDSILLFIQSPAFRMGKWEPLYRYMTRKRTLGHYRYYLQQATLYAAAEPMVGDGIPIFYESVRETSARMNDFAYIDCTGTDKDSVAKKRNDLADLGLIGKSTNLDHPAFAKAKEYKERLGNLHHKEFLFIPDLTEEILEFALQQVSEAKHNGERARFKSRAALLTSRGNEVADRIFLQDAGKELTRNHLGFIYFTLYSSGSK